MIRINLLPPELAGKKKAHKVAKPAPSIIVLLILLPVYFITFFVVYKVYDLRATSFYELEQNKKKLERLKKQKADNEKKYTDLQETYSILNEQVEILLALDPPDRLLWSEKINMLSELIPKGVYLTSVRVSEKVEQVETSESKRKQAEWNAMPKEKRGTAPEIVKKPIIRQTLEMDGITHSEKGGSAERLDLIAMFYQALQTFATTNNHGKKAAFMDNFNPKISLKDIANTKISDVEVSKFTFTITTKPFTTDVEADKNKATAKPKNAPAKAEKEKSEKEGK